MLKRRPEKDMLGCFCQVANSGEESNLVYASYRSSLDQRVRKYLRIGVNLRTVRIEQEKIRQSSAKIELSLQRTEVGEREARGERERERIYQ